MALNNNKSLQTYSLPVKIFHESKQLKSMNPLLSHKTNESHHHTTIKIKTFNSQMVHIKHILIQYIYIYINLNLFC